MNKVINILNLDVCAPDGRSLLTSVSFELLKNEKKVLIGPNGCGKSTLLKCIAGLIPIRCGKGTVFDVSEKVIYLPTRPLDLLLPWLTVEENIRIFLSLYMRSNKGKCGFDDLCYGKDIGYDLDRYRKTHVYKLSSGQQSFLSIYCALIQCPKLLIADEVFSTLSKTVQAALISFLKIKDMSILFASHDIELIKDMEKVMKLFEALPEKSVPVSIWI
jgi:ABC-type multidrug transport system ATPase subunit